MAFDTLRKAQPENVRLLENNRRKNRLAHAYVFEGMAGTKKMDTALFFASMLLCDEEDGPCGTCKNCRRIAHETHPNVYVIRPDKKTITKSMIQDLQTEFHKTAVETGAKIYIIDEAERMNAHAANALLKFLEEPHNEIFALLLTENATKLLPTIRSRSQTLHFHTIPHSIILEELKSEGYDDEDARVAAALSRTTEAAKAWIGRENFRDLIELTTALYEAYAEGEPLIITFEREHFGVLRQPDDYLAFFDVMSLYQKDLVYGKMKHYTSIVFQSQRPTMERILPQKSQAMLVEELERMVDVQARIDQYINVRLAMDNVLLLMERRMNHGT